jgi:hypothetical protein
MHKEFQVFYIKPLDSLMLRVNTLDFDESLSFTGDGSERNNFLMDMFLHNEAEIDLMPKLYKRSPLEFEKALDSLKIIRTKFYNEFAIKEDPDEAFKEVAQASIDYDYYSKKEIYITANRRKKGTGRYFEIPDSFYNYRENIDFGSEILRSYFPYYRFLFRYFDNIVVDENFKYNKNSYEHNYNKIKIIEEKITNDSLKNSMVKNIASRYMLNCNEKENHKKMLKLFLETNTNQQHKNDIIEIAKASMKLTPGHKISNLLLITPDNTLKDLQSIIYKPTVFYFWSPKSANHYRSIHKKATELNSKYPEYDFIGINTDSNFANWSAIINKKGYNKAKEFQFNNLSKAEKELVIYSVNKAIIVDSNGVIINGSANLFNPNIEDILLGYLNK